MFGSMQDMAIRLKDGKMEQNLYETDGTLVNSTTVMLLVPKKYFKIYLTTSQKLHRMLILKFRDSFSGRGIGTGMTMPTRNNIKKI